MKNKVNKLNPPQLLVLIFLSLILIGTIILWLPVSHTEDLSFLDALFTATSAMTVTGLIVVDTGSAFTIFGQVIILLLIQLGGLGIMTFAVLIFFALGRKIGLKERLLIKQALNQEAIGGVILLARKLLIFSLIMESIAVIFLSIKWVPEMGWRDGIYSSVFHAISAFNNAGFSIWGDSLSQYATDPIINFIITSLFIVGGIGFTVVFDIWKRVKFRKFSLHTKLMIVGTLIINLFSIFMVFILEFDNPHTLGNMSTFGQIQASYFQALTPRTAGFNTVDISHLSDSTLFYIIVLMFIGGGSASTAGGIKLTTALTVLLSTIAFLRKHEQVTAFDRSITQQVVTKSLALITVSSFTIVVVVFILNLTEKANFLTILFEAVSAFGTVGLSMGLTGSLTAVGKVTIIVTMLIGKLGPLTFAFAFAKETKAKVKYPKEDVLTG